MASRFQRSAYCIVSTMTNNPEATQCSYCCDSQVIGALTCGEVADRIGRRYTIMIALAVSFGAITMEFAATSNELFFGGKFLNGFAVGTLQAASGSYVGEVSLNFSFSCMCVKNIG